MGIDPGGGGVLYTGVCNYLINWLPWGTQLTYWGTPFISFLRWLGYLIIPTVLVDASPAGVFPGRFVSTQFLQMVYFKGTVADGEMLDKLSVTQAQRDIDLCL